MSAAARPLRRAAEALIVACAALYAAQGYLNFDSNVILNGWEMEWLTSSAFSAATTLQTEGYLPRWQPYLGRGEPLVESPFAFALNPLSSAPSLIFGAENGIKISVVGYTLFAAFGGWVLGTVLGLGALSRVLLALLCLGGGMLPVISRGYFQLGTAQAYFSWVTAAALAICRFRRSRAAVVGLALGLALLFWAGNIYYTLPALVMVGGLTLVFAARRPQTRWQIDGALIRRVGLALLLSAALAAVTLLPMFANRGLIGGHPDEDPTEPYLSPLVAAAQWFIAQPLYPLTTPWQETYANFVLPVGFAALIFVLLPPISPALQRSARPRLHRRVLIAALGLISFFLLWGTGTNPLMRWAYAHLPLIGQWRVLSRMLTVGAFWLAVVTALRVEGLWRAIQRWRLPLLRQAAAAGLILASALAGYTLIDAARRASMTTRIDDRTAVCVEWLRLTHPDVPLAVYAENYFTVYPYLRHQVRFTHINADFQPQGIASTLGDGDLTAAPPEYVLSFSDTQRAYWRERGYQFVADSLTFSDGAPCLMRRENTLGYAFTVPLDALPRLFAAFNPALTTPITALSRHSDYVALIAGGSADAEMVVAVQELAWRGWNVTVDGAPAQIESVGQLIGVVLPKGDAQHHILFVYDPPLLKIGGAITLITALGCGWYLLRKGRP